MASHGIVIALLDCQLEDPPVVLMQLYVDWLTKFIDADLSVVIFVYLFHRLVQAFLALSVFSVALIISFSKKVSCYKASMVVQ